MLKKLFAGAGLVLSTEIMAAPVVLTPLTDAVDFSTVITAVMTVAGAVVGVYVTWRAAKIVLQVIKSA